jgi:hypothetical protein
MARSKSRCIFYCFLRCLGSHWSGINGGLGANPAESFQKELGSLAKQSSWKLSISRTMPPFLGESAAFLFNLVDYVFHTVAGFSLLCILKYRISNKEFRTAEVFERSKTKFFTSLFCGSLFCGFAVHILKDVMAGYSIGQNYYHISGISVSWRSRLRLFRFK